MLKGLAHALRNAAYSDYHLVRTTHEWASVFTIEGARGRKVRVLDVGGAFQSATYIDKHRFEPVFEYYRMFDTVFHCGIPVRHVLMIGGGGCSWPKHAATAHARLTIDVAESDPAVIDIARRYFFVRELEQPSPDHGTVRLIAADGRSYLERTEDKNGEAVMYDAILNDAFQGAMPALNLATVEAARVFAFHLRPRGVYLANVVSRDEGSDLSFLRDTVATLREAFPHVQVIPCPDADYSDEDNFLVAASHQKLTLEDSLPYDSEFVGTPLYDGDIGSNA